MTMHNTDLHIRHTKQTYAMLPFVNAVLLVTVNNMRLIYIEVHNNAVVGNHDVCELCGTGTLGGTS
jgi:hypothetical protein